METQTVINVAIATVGALMGAILRAVWDSVQDLQISDKAIIKDVSALQVLVAGNYIKREEFDKALVALFAKLDKIDSKLDMKVNTVDCHGKVCQ